MITEQQIQQVIGATAIGSDGKVGKVGEVYLDDESGRPEWVTVNTGLFGTHETFIPLNEASLEGGELRLPYEKSQVKDAPRIDDAKGHLSPESEQELYRYYGLEGTSTEPTADAAQFAAEPAGDRRTQSSHDDAGYRAAGSGDVSTIGGQDDRRAAAGHDTSGPTTDAAMTRSEEQLTVGTERVESGRARLRKFVVTENVSRTVPVSHEEVRLEREPITDANASHALDGPAISEEEHEVVLHAERPVVEKETVPIERVRLGTQTVTEDAVVNEQVRKEQIEMHSDDADRR